MKHLSFKKKALAMVLVLAVVLAAASVFALQAEGENNPFIGTFWSLVPPIVAIVLALITKEVHSSLFAGILVGGFFYANFNPVTAMHTIIDNGFVAVLSDSWNVGILIFTILLGVVSALSFKAGGTVAYGKWALKNIKTRKGAQLSTMALGCLIFVDDYFNCLTVGNVMRPVTDSHQVSRAKLAYFIDATAAPVCIIAPISSWAAAVTGVVQGYGSSPYSLFLDSIGFNFYALFTLTMVLCVCLMDIDFGPMKTHEENARKGDLYTTPDRPYADAANDVPNEKGKTIDLILPIFAILIPCCILGLLYTGGFFSGETFVDAFANCDASLGLVYGSLIGIIIMLIYYLFRGVMSFKEFMDCLPQGFRNMVPAVLILIFAWTLSAMTGLLGAAEYVAAIVDSAAGNLANFLPAIIFLIASGLSFATGTSWGTFGILLPIVVKVFPIGNPLLIVGVGACLAGAVVGDHCSPISDTTIMASAGAQCNHINHVSTQLPYVLVCAAVCFVFYIIAGFWQSFIVTILGIAAMVGLMFLVKTLLNKKASCNCKKEA